MKDISLGFLIAIVAIPLGVAASGTACNPETPVPGYLQSECLGCSVAAELDRCSDGVDNDEDGLDDCFDPDCARAYVCTAIGAENKADFCADGLDNDSNGYTDCGDFGCVATTACRTDVQEPEETSGDQCSDGLDNDWNGHIDCGDFSCGGAPGCEGSNSNCSDGKDNDGNGFTDCGDFGCSQNSSVTVCK